jgi:hypothetical protein
MAQTKTKTFEKCPDCHRLMTASGVCPHCPCKHLTGYWINKAMRNFRCYQCQYQFHIGDDLPANHPTKGIEVWEGNQ